MSGCTVEERHHVSLLVAATCLHLGATATFVESMNCLDQELARQTVQHCDLRIAYTITIM